MLVKRFSKYIACIMALILCFSYTSLSFADSSTIDIDLDGVQYSGHDIIKSKEIVASYDIINKVDPYVEYDASTNQYYINTASLPANVTDAEINYVNSIINNTNTYLKDNDFEYETTNKNIVMARRGGVTKVIFRWYGWDVYLSHSAVSYIYRNHDLPSAIAGAFDPVAAAMIVGLGHLINSVDAGNGVILRLRHGVPPVLFWISKQ